MCGCQKCDANTHDVSPKWPGVNVKLEFCLSCFSGGVLLCYAKWMRCQNDSRLFTG